MAFISTLGATNANSYISASRATTVLSDLPVSDGVTEWLSLIDADKQKTLVAATLSIDPLPWKGSVCSESQNLAWPRVVNFDGRYTVCESLPYDLELATAYTAAFMGNQGGYTAVSSGGGPETVPGLTPLPGLSPQELAGYEQVSLAKGEVNLKLANPNAMPSGVMYVPPFASDLLSKYLKGRSGITVARMRSDSMARIAAPFLSPRYRMVKTKEINGQIYPLTGGWASNPL